MTQAPESVLGALRDAYRRLRDSYGHRQWWPARTPFEVAVGAILVQNTSWENAARAVARLEAAGRLTPASLAALSSGELAALVHPAGCARVKADRLRAFLTALGASPDSGFARLLELPTGEARRRLLAVRGIGPETADCILLYGGGRLSYVIDAYTRRVFVRHGWTAPGRSYDDLQRLCSDAFSGGGDLDRLDLWRDGHAQWVEVGKRCCRAARPRCDLCPLSPLLPPGGPWAMESPTPGGAFNGAPATLPGERRSPRR